MKVWDSAGFIDFSNEVDSNEVAQLVAGPDLPSPAVKLASIK